MTILIIQFIHKYILIVNFLTLQNSPLLILDLSLEITTEISLVYIISVYFVCSALCFFIQQHLGGLHIRTYLSLLCA